MKKILSLFVLLFAVVTLSSCELLENSGVTYEIAMITDAGDIDDKSFNQGTWEGIVEFAVANEITHKYYKPLDVSDTAYVAAIDLAVAAGAKIVVTPGFLFEAAIYEAQAKYPDVIFVLIDGVPHPGDYSVFTVGDNTRSILFKEQESGFLAGYAAVMEGYRSLGFMGGIAVPAVVRFGLGYVAGAYYAADELGLEDFEFNMDYYEYLGTFAPGDDVKVKASTWYAAGVEVIHVAAGGAGNSVMAAAEELEGKFVIGVDIDQASQSPAVITSAMKALGVVVKQALQDYVDGDFEGGETLILGAAQDAVALPLGDSFKFDNFTVAQYEAILAKLVDGTIVLPMDAEGLNEFIDDLKVVEVVIPEPELEVLFTFDFGTAGRNGYAAGMIFENEDGTWTNLLATNSAWDDTIHSVNKNRVQIGTSTFGVKDTMGAFLVFAPVGNTTVAYMEFEVDLDNNGYVAFDHIVWNDSQTPANILTLDFAVIRLEIYNATTEAWDIVASVDLKTNMGTTEIVNEIIPVLAGAATYRIVYVIEGENLSNTNTFYAVIVDNLTVSVYKD